MNDSKFLNFIELANKLYQMDQRVTIIGSVAYYIYTGEKFDDFEMDIVTTSPVIRELLESWDYIKVVNLPEIEEIKKKLGYEGVNDPRQTFFLDPSDKTIIDLSLREKNDYETQVVKVHGYEVRVPTLRQLIEIHQKASERKDIPEYKREAYKQKTEHLKKLEKNVIEKEKIIIVSF